MFSFILSNWMWFLLGFFIAEKIVKLTPSKNDDILFDIIVANIVKFCKFVFIKCKELVIYLKNRKS